MMDVVENWTQEMKMIMKLDGIPSWWSIDCIEVEGYNDKQIPSSNPGRHLVLSEINCSCLGLVTDTSEEGKQKGTKYADMIADICLI
ncbi:hypothetical protein LSH36_174g03053 [Paralvinella palmiformis]|uniref:DUF6815 domain-containing protein n=1 Tax=Paralvinella palmiformis TaxID=53620 RepID=A0AAD9N8P4_9ANNE|nr:hypothetical protein LSH36_174g03053 [Paralvinella palmiformis]